MRNASVLILIVVLCFSSFQFLRFASAASSAALYLDPSTIEWTIHFDFAVTLKIDNVTDLHDWQAELEWDPQILNCTGIYDGDFFNDSIYTIKSSVDQTGGWAYMFDQLESGHTLPGVNGSGTLASILFNVIAVGECILSLNHTKLFDSSPELVSTPPNLGDYNNDSTVNMRDISSVILHFWSSVGSPGYDPNADFDADGFVDLFDLQCSIWNFNHHYPPYPEPSQAYRPVEIPHSTSGTNVHIIGIHDITVEDVTPTKTVVTTGDSMSINATVTNEVYFQETFNVALFANDIFIALQNVTLVEGASLPLCFTWNSTGFAKGSYSVTMVAEPVQGEMNIGDNYVTIYVFITIAGDLNGDQVVDIYDAIILANHFGIGRYHPLWDANIDINNDDFIDIFDAILLAANYGKSWT